MPIKHIRIGRIGWRIDQLNKAGYLVVVKFMPPDFGYLLSGSRSEYDVPVTSKRKIVAKGKVCVEAHDMRIGKERGKERGPGIYTAFGDDAGQAFLSIKMQMSADMIPGCGKVIESKHHREYRRKNPGKIVRMDGTLGNEGRKLLPGRI